MLHRVAVAGPIVAIGTQVAGLLGRAPNLAAKVADEARAIGYRVVDVSGLGGPAAFNLWAKAPLGGAFKDGEEILVGWIMKSGLTTWIEGGEFWLERVTKQ